MDSIKYKLMNTADEFATPVLTLDGKSSSNIRVLSLVVTPCIM